MAGPQYMGGRAGPVERAPVRRSNTMPPNLGNAGILGRAVVEERVPGLDSPLGSTFLHCFQFFYTIFNMWVCYICSQVQCLTQAWSELYAVIITGLLWLTPSLLSVTGRDSLDNNVLDLYSTFSQCKNVDLYLGLRSLLDGSRSLRARGWIG